MRNNQITNNMEISSKWMLISPTNKTEITYNVQKDKRERLGEKIVKSKLKNELFILLVNFWNIYVTYRLKNLHGSYLHKW